MAKYGDDSIVLRTIDSVYHFAQQGYQVLEKIILDDIVYRLISFNATFRLNF